MLYYFASFSLLDFIVVLKATFQSSFVLEGMVMESLLTVQLAGMLTTMPHVFLLN